MRADRASATALAIAIALAACQTQPGPHASKTAPPPTQRTAAATCRVGPDGSPDLAHPDLTHPDLADRGIGGTGAPPQSMTFADRGIGGTGIDTAKTSNGNTGIVGVITGFASVCLAGQEVALPPDVPIALETQPASPGALRAGQVAVIEADSQPTGLTARRIVIRYEVIGPVERVDQDRLRIAGQDVLLSPQTWGPRPTAGDWVAVSGLRRADGTIDATRLEPRPPGPILVHGPLTEQDGGLRIGALPVRRDPATVAFINLQVTLTGMIGQNGELLPLSVSPDLLEVDPAAFFGPRVGVVFIEGFAVFESGRLRFAPGFSAPAPNLAAPSRYLDGSQRGVFRLERVDGSLRATSLGSAFQSVPRYEPAPIPNRALRAPGAQGLDRSGPFRRPLPGGRFNRQDGDQTPNFAPPTGNPGFAPSSGGGDPSFPRFGPQRGR